MGLFRLLILIALVFAAVWLWRRLTRKPRPASRSAAPAMVRCAQCGVHIPKDRALHGNDRWYCSQAHLEQDRSHGGR
ncbi:PP0621 family protein [Stutzerimonas azotifigens]|uniref:PP0621 family protein n=1 Tax=Stutzerimonas azotifigens TaxID=291995 RepID=UPI000401BCCE|nr:PP0621 family protein [Stutzerimonas azotifigens]